MTANFYHRWYWGIILATYILLSPNAQGQTQHEIKWNAPAALGDVIALSYERIPSDTFSLDFGIRYGFHHIGIDTNTVFPRPQPFQNTYFTFDRHNLALMSNARFYLKPRGKAKQFFVGPSVIIVLNVYRDKGYDLLYEQRVGRPYESALLGWLGLGGIFGYKALINDRFSIEGTLQITADVSDLSFGIFLDGFFQLNLGYRFPGVKKE